MPFRTLRPSGHQSYPWRTIAVVAAGVATLELLGLLIVGIEVLLAKPVLHCAHSTAAAAPLPVVKKLTTTPTRPTACAVWSR